MKHDFLGNELKIGDDVVFITPGYRDLSKGTIISETPNYFQIQRHTTDPHGHFDKIKQTPDQLIKIQKW